MNYEDLDMQRQLMTRFKWGIFTGIGVAFAVMWIALELAKYIYV